MTAADIVSVDEKNFQYQVVAYSDKVPVLVDYWADWSDASQRISPILEGLARQLSGRFRLAKLSVDSNQQLARRFQIHTVPTLAVFENGEVIHQMSGNKTNLQVIDFVKRSIPSPENLLLTKGQAYYGRQQYREAEAAARELLEEDPENSRGQLLLLKSTLGLGNVIDAQVILDHFPASPEYQTAELLQPLVKALFSYRELGLKSSFPGEAVFYRALDLTARGNFPAALDGLLSLLQKDKEHHQGLTKELVLGILELLDPESDLAKEYRQRLANTIF